MTKRATAVKPTKTTNFLKKTNLRYDTLYVFGVCILADSQSAKIQNKKKRNNSISIDSKCVKLYEIDKNKKS